MILYVLILKDITLMRNIISRNPYSGQIKEQIAFLTQQALERLFERTAMAFRLHSLRSTKDKTSMIQQLIPQIQRQKNEISRLITFETGKPIVQAENQVKQALRICDYYSKHSEAILAVNVKSTAKKKTLIKFMPTGTVYCILPFTNAFALTLYNTLPQILLGNCVMVKNTATTPGIGKLMQRLMANAGFQSGQYQNCFASRDQSGQILSRNQVVGVNFTGSTQNGRNVAAIAGKYIKNSLLQLSCNDAMIVMEDANINEAIQNVMKAGYFNSGQGGPNPKRIIIDQTLYEKFRQRLIEKAAKIKYGNPLDRETMIGPLSRPDIYEKLESQLHNLPKTYKIIYQKQQIQKPFFPITIIEADACNLDQQFIGPVFILHKAKGNADSINIANQSRFGNSHYIFSSKSSQEVAQNLRGGSIYINQIGNINSFIPKGGVGLGGYGREGGQEGIRRFANIKTVYIN